jgi:fructokinase
MEQIPEPVICLGEALIDILPVHRAERLQQATLLKRVAGGAPANVTVGLARLGVPAAFLGKVGTDPFGYFLRDTLSAEGVDVSHMLFSNEANTGLAFAWVEDITSGEARYLFFRQPSADRLLCPAELDREWLARARALQFGSLLLSVEPGASATWAAIETARQAGVPCVYDVNLRLPAWKDAAAARAGMLAPLEASDMVKLNRHELAFLTGETDLERGVAKIWRSNYRLLVVTLDRDGCYFRTAAGSGRIAGLPVKVVDTVGSGDAFVAALLAQLLIMGDKDSAGKGLAGVDFEKLDLVEAACRYANAAGAATALRSGAIPALPTHRRIVKLLNAKF